MSASSDAELRPAIGRALARTVNNSLSVLIATRAGAEPAIDSIDRDAEAGAVVSALGAALAVLEAAALRDRSAQSDAFTPVGADSDGLVHTPQHRHAVREPLKRVEIFTTSL